MTEDGTFFYTESSGFDISYKLSASLPLKKEKAIQRIKSMVQQLTINNYPFF